MEQNNEYNFSRNFIQDKNNKKNQVQVKTFRNRNIEDILDIYDDEDEKK